MSIEYGHYVPADQNITRFTTGHYVQQVEVNDGFLVVKDPQLGSFIVGNNNSGNIYYDLFTTADHYRSGGISQLSKQDFHATIPNTASLNRAWHNLGLFRVVDYFAHKQDLSDEQKLGIVLAECINDRGHMDFSHALEPSMQGYSTQEDWHETLWEKVAAVGGTARVLEKHGVRNEKFIMPGIEIPPWANDPAPDINSDRFQYTATELLLWFDHDQAPTEVREVIRSIVSLDNLTVTEDGKLAFTTLEAAQIFAKGYLLLTTEHWNDAINRIQLHLLVEASKRAVTKRRISWMNDVDKGVTRFPDEYFLGVDADIDEAMKTRSGDRDDFMFAVRNLLNTISMQERERFIDYKSKDYSAFLLDAYAHDYPSELLTPKRVDFGPPSSTVSIDFSLLNGTIQTGPKMPALLEEEEGVCYYLPPLKNRYVDPLVMFKGKPIKLSELDANYHNLLREQQHVRSAAIVVRLALAGDFEAAFKTGLKENKHDFEQLLRAEVPRMTLDQRRKIIEMGAARANAAAQKAGRLILNV